MLRNYLELFRYYLYREYLGLFFFREVGKGLGKLNLYRVYVEVVLEEIIVSDESVVNGGLYFLFFLLCRSLSWVK